MSVGVFDAALDGARTLARVDEIARDFWIAHGAGAIGDSDAERIAARIEEARRRIKPEVAVRGRAPGVPLAAISMFAARKRRCVSPDRAASRARRRRLAYSGPLPPALAAGFTTGQLATLRIVADEVRARGFCALTLGEIAARAGVGVTTVRNAIRVAAGDGLLVIVERRRRGAPSLPNIVRIISSEWRAWIVRGERGGSKMPNPTDKVLIPEKRRTSVTDPSLTKKRSGGRRDQPLKGGAPFSALLASEANGKPPRICFYRVIKLFKEHRIDLFIPLYYGYFGG